VDQLHNLFFDVNKKSAVDIIYLNCRSLKKHFSEILQLLELVSGPLTAMAVTETWLTYETQDLYNIPGYNFVSNTRPDNIGGGVGIFVNRMQFDFIVRLDLSRMNSFIECLFVVIELHQKNKLKVLLGCVYRPPNYDINLFNCEIVDLLKLIDIERNAINSSNSR